MPQNLKELHISPRIDSGCDRVTMTGTINDLIVIGGSGVKQVDDYNTMRDANGGCLYIQSSGN